MIALKSNRYEADILPETGGAIGRFALAGMPVLRRVAPGLADAAESCCFPLVPFANRIAGGRIAFAGRAAELPPGYPGHPHALHGQGWRTAWRVVSHSAHEARLAYDYRPGVWPWSYAAEQTFRLDGNGLTVRLGVANTDGTAMPVSLGLHPFFPRTAATVLTAEVGGVWLNDPTVLPVSQADGAHFFDLARGARLCDAPAVDNCHTGWQGRAAIDQPDIGLKVTLDASPECRFLHIFAPPGSDFVCAEPVSAMPDCFGRDEPPEITGVRALAPGETFSIEMRIAAEPR
jgi:aldose 1-epimerase